MSRKKKPLSPKQFRAKTRKYLGKRQPVTGKKATRDLKARSTSYAKGTKLVSDVAATLRQVAKSHPDPKARKKATDAIKKLDAARTEFGSASLCMTVVFNGDGN